MTRDELEEAVKKQKQGFSVLTGAYLPAPGMVLLAYWGKLSDKLTLECMRHDAANHPHPEKFQIWADGGPCPYADILVQRAINFQENKLLWKKSKKRVLHAYELMTMILAEKCKI